MWTEQELYDHVDHLEKSMSLLTPSFRFHILAEALGRLIHNNIVEALEDPELASSESQF